MKRYERLLGSVFIGILVYLPFHAPLSTWAISNFGHAAFFKVFKDIILFGLAATVLYVEREYVKTLNSQRLFRAIAVYVGAVLFWSCFSMAEWDARLAGIVMDLRFVAAFMVAYVLVQRNRITMNLVQKSVYVPLAGVVLFGVLQWWVLPIDILRHIGYSAHTIPAYMTIDNNPHFIRILSTLRGPNPLGAYLACLVLSAVLWVRRFCNLWWSMLLAGGVLVVLYASGSRSAWVGAVVACLAFVYMQHRSRLKQSLVLAVAAVIMVLGVGVYQMRHTPFIARTLLHTDLNDTNSYNSDNNRLATLAVAAHDLIREPFGRGVGTSGLASTYNTHASRITENYFLQVGEEMGVFGVGVFMYIVYAITRKLLDGREVEDYAIAAGWIGLVVIALLWPVYSDETTSVIAWTLAAVVLAKNKRST